LKVFLIEKIDKLNLCELPIKELTIIDVNSWFKTNGLSPEDMNGVRQFIFDEWITKKVSSIKPKENTELSIVVIYETPSDKFLSFLKRKLLENFGHSFYDIVLVEDEN
jgi:hypothetical protein